MTVDLPTLLAQAAPEPREPVDVDAVLGRARQLGRRRVALQAAVAVVAVLGIAGVSSVLFDAPQRPFVSGGPVATTPTPVPGTYADGAVVVSEPGQDVTLDLRTDARLQGQPIAEIPMVPTELAVAADGAVGVLDGSTLRILHDDDELATTSLLAVLSGLARDEPSNTGWPSTAAQLKERDISMAFDRSGTFWVSVGGPGGGIVGLRRDGNVTATAGPQQEHQELRVLGDAVSVTTYTDPAYGRAAADATVTPVVGDDPRAGTHRVPVIPGSGYPYRGLNSAQHRIGIATILGTGRVRLANSRDDVGAETPRTVVSLWGTARVADTAAGLVAKTQWEPAVLIVHRADGTVVGALLGHGVEPETEQRLTTSPDGAVHLASATEDGGMVVHTLLRPDLQPPTADDLAAAKASGLPELPEGEYVDLPFDQARAVVPWQLPLPILDDSELEWDGRASVLRRSNSQDGDDHFMVVIELQQATGGPAQDAAGHGRGIVRLVYLRASAPEPGRGPPNATLDDGTPAWVDDSGSVDVFKEPLYIQIDGDPDADLLAVATSIVERIEPVGAAP